MTAEEFAKKQHPMKTYPVDWEIMVEFAKLKVEEALKEASEKAEITYYMRRSMATFSHHKHYIVDKNSILNSYDLNNIK